MAIVNELGKRTATLKLNNGTTASGSVKLVSCSLPTLTLGNGYTDAKAVAVRDALAQCLALEVEDVQKAETYSVYDDGSA